MNGIMARFAKRNAIRYVVTQCWMICKILDVVSIKVSTSCITTMLACIVISLKYCTTPISIFRTFTFNFIQRCNSTFPRMAFSATRSFFTNNTYYFIYCFTGVFFSKSQTWFSKF